MKTVKMKISIVAVALLLVTGSSAPYVDDCFAAASRAQRRGECAADHYKHLCWYGHPYVSMPARHDPGNGTYGETAVPCFVHCFGHPLVSATDCSWTGAVARNDTRRAAADVSRAGFLSLVAYTSDYVSRNGMHCAATKHEISRSRSSVPMIGIFV